jgi:hypothetical protein
MGTAILRVRFFVVALLSHRKATKPRHQNRLLHGWTDGLASGCVFKKWCRTCNKVTTCSFWPQLSSASRISSMIMSRTFSLPCSRDKRYSASAVAAISGRCSCSAIASTSSSVRPHNPMQSSSVIIRSLMRQDRCLSVQKFKGRAIATQYVAGED